MLRDRTGAAVFCTELDSMKLNMAQQEGLQFRIVGSGEESCHVPVLVKIACPPKPQGYYLPFRKHCHVGPRILVLVMDAYQTRQGDTQ